MAMVISQHNPLYNKLVQQSTLLLLLVEILLVLVFGWIGIMMVIFMIQVRKFSMEEQVFSKHPIVVLLLCLEALVMEITE